MKDRRAKGSLSGLAASLSACVALIVPPGTSHAADAGLLDAATAAQPGVIKTLGELVSIESGSADRAGLERIATYAEARLRALGARTERVAPTTGDSPIVKAVFRGQGDARVMLIAHMDTIYAAGTLASQPFRQDGNKLYGPGIADDKSGIAVILHSLEILLRSGWNGYGTLTVLLNADEEIGSRGSGDIIARLADEHDAVLSCEPVAARAVVKVDPVLLGASGVATAKLEVKGRAAHAGSAPETGRNALMELAHQLQQTRDAAREVKGTTLNWTVARAGGVQNQIPDVATAVGDIRSTERDGPQQLQEVLRRKIAETRLIPDTETSVAVSVGRPAFVANEGGRALARLAQQVYAELDGKRLYLAEGTGGGTDAGYAARSGKVAVLEGLGLAGFGYHARDEYIEIDSIVPRLYLMMRLLQDIGKR